MIDNTATHNINAAHAFEGADIRISGTPDKPLFCAQDVCTALGIANSRDALGALDEDEKGVAITDTHGGKQSMAFVTESGLYHLIFKSRKAAAKRFRRWVTGYVLPTLRTTGTVTVTTNERVAMTLPEWLESMGLSLRDDANKCASMAQYVRAAASYLRWNPSTRADLKDGTSFQEVPRPVLEMAEGMFIQGNVRIAPPARKDTPVITVQSSTPIKGGTIAQILAAKRAAQQSQQTEA